MKMVNNNLITSNINHINSKQIPFWKYTSGAFRPNAPKQWDICYKYEYPYNVLCNFTQSHFFFDGIEIYSMEGFLQALKVKDPEIQRKICTLPGFLAKKLGNYLKRSGEFDREHLYWKGVTYKRASKEYQNLLDRVYDAKYLQDKNFRNTLKLSKGYKLTHDIGKSDPFDTVLTDKEFITHLNILRSKKNLPIFKYLTYKLYDLYNSKKNPLYISKIFKEKNTTFINGHFMCGESLFNEENLKYINKKNGIHNIIDVNFEDISSEKRDLFCKKQGLGYINIDSKTIHDINTIKQLIKIYDSGKFSYISCKERKDANIPLAINYLFNPKSDISDAIIFGSPTKKFIKNMTNIGKEIYSQKETPEISEFSDFNSFMAKLKILSELN